MPKKKRPDLTDEERAKRLKAMAREVEADENGGNFKKTFKRLADFKPAAGRPRRGAKPSSP
jgi:hypothetical protein